MDVPITFTVSDFVAWFLSLCGGIAAIGVAIGWIIKAVNVAKKPNRKQDERLDAIETKMKEYDTFFAEDKRRLDDIDKGNRVTQRAILALLSHGIDGNDRDSMIQAKQELTDYLTRR